MNLNVAHQVEKIKLWLLVAFSVVILSACSPTREQVHLQGATMGTTYNIKYIKKDGIASQKTLHTQIDKILEQVNDQMSTYRPHSELSQFNKFTQTTPFTVSTQMATVVKEAIRLNKVTEGVLDITVGPLVNLWGFGPEQRVEEMPTDAEIATRRREVGIQHLSVKGNQVRKDLPSLYVDLSTIAKGWGVDQVASYLQQQGIDDFMVEIGGEMRLQGHNRDDIPWRIAIEKPTVDARSAQEIIEPGNMAVATSGDYRNYFEENGIRYSHIIDPRTGRPINNKVVSVSVLTDSCMTADGLATGLMVLGEDEGMRIANEQKLAVFMIVKTKDGFKEIASDAFKPFLNQKKSNQ